MSYQVLARKWRPKNFSELLGQDSARQTLTNSLKQNRLYPVLIFTGPRGTGKTSTARIVAKSLRCQKSSFEPCEKCKDCLLIADSRHLDVIEIDGASNNGVDAIRDLRDTVSYMPNSGKWKIYIIDEVHMLSNSAFNALLKTLEEPPGHVLFIMATTESHKIPQTVLSRSQKIDFHLLSPSLIKQHLEKISQQESISISESALWILAKQAKGSLRDAQSLLDQVISFCGEDLSENNVRKLLGLSDSLILSDCILAIIEKKESDLIECISHLRQKGIPADIFLQNLISSLTELLFLKKNPLNQPPLVQASKQEIELKKNQAQRISYEELHLLLDMLLKGEKEMKFCHDNELILEVLLLRLCTAPKIEEIAPLSATHPSLIKPEGSKATTKDLKKESLVSNKSSEKDLGEKIEKNPEQNSTKASKEEAKKSLGDFAQPSKTSFANSSSSSKAFVSPTPAKASSSVSSASAPSSSTSSSNKASSVELKNLLDFLDHLHKKDPSLSGLLESFHWQESSPSEFCFFVPPNLSYLKEKMNSKLKSSLEKQLALFLDQKVSMQFEVSDSCGPSLKEKRKQSQQDHLRGLAEKHPAVKQVKAVLSAKIQSVKALDKM